MRPVTRGTHPVDDHGTRIPIKHYQDARGPLIKRLGDYCSYCEMQLDASLAVEHVQPKSRNPTLETCWDNFLLACTNCNSTKGSKAIELDDYVWPDKDNTFPVFAYYASGVVEVAADLDQDEAEKAQRTLDLTGFGLISPNRSAFSNRRWIGRRDAWNLAQRALSRLGGLHEDALRAQIIDTAVSRGYWSVWMTVFAADADMRQRLIKEFTGTNRDYQY